jgi:magnesium-transporting ATPase (P-type)
VVGAFDCDVSRAAVLRHPLMAYNTGRLGEMLNLKNMAKWCLFPFFQGLLLFVCTVRFCSGPLFAFSSAGGLFTFSIYGTGLNSVDDGWGYGFYAEGFLIYSVAVVAMQIKVVSMHSTPNIIFWGLWVLSFVGYFFFSFLYGLSPSLDWYNTVPLAFSQPQYWLAMLLVPVVLSVSDAAFDVLWAALDPSSNDRLLQLLASETTLSAATHPDDTIRDTTSVKQTTVNPLL